MTDDADDYVPDPAATAFVERIVAECPALRPMLDEHIADNYSELLSHVFFGTLTLWAEARAVDAEGDVRTLARLVEVLEDGYTGDDGPVDNLIAVSFVENIDPAMHGWLGPRLTAERRRQEAWRPAAG